MRGDCFLSREFMMCSTPCQCAQQCLQLYLGWQERSGKHTSSFFALPFHRMSTSRARLNKNSAIPPKNKYCVLTHRTYTIEWTGTSAGNRFEIDLYHCGSICMEVSVYQLPLTILQEVRTSGNGHNDGVVVGLPGASSAT